jgi:predicted Ser/Thr protein kinase
MISALDPELFPCRMSSVYGFTISWTQCTHGAKRISETSGQARYARYKKVEFPDAPEVTILLCRTCRTDNEPAAAICRSCGRSLTALAKGELLAGRFEILAVIGSGGMGIVYKAHDRSLEEDVALKVLRPEFAMTREAARRFQSEIKLARKVSDRHVCRIYEYGEDGGLRYICMELVDGVNLKQLVQDQGPLPHPDAYEASIQIADGLSAIHEAGVIHRDLKTPNIMRDTRGLVRLMDFGIAREMESAGLTMAGQVMGTPEYMSPEQALGQKLDFRTDIYSLGIVIFELFAGQVPFRGENPVATVLKQIEERPPLEDQMPESLVPVLSKALAKDRAQRFASARGIAAALRLARDHAPRPSVTDPGSLTATTSAFLNIPVREMVAATGARAAAPEVPTPERPATPAHLPATPASMAMAAVRLDPILKDLQSGDDSVRWRAVLALGAIGKGSRPALLALLAAMGDDDEAVRRAAVSALGRLGSSAREVVPALISSLRDDSLREAAAESLVMIGLPAVPALLEAVQSGTSAVRWQAAEALTRIGRAS